MLREIVLDTETTGTDAERGDRLVEIGAVELLNHVPTGRNFHKYINPERAVSAGAFGVHGLSDAFLADKPKFREVAAELVDFLGDARLVIHNAAFDVAFLNAAFATLPPPRPAPIALAAVVDTLALARRRHPGASNSLDALCSRYGIDNSRRTKHGALLDSEILAEVYLELIGGKQTGLDLTVAPARTPAPDPAAPLLAALGSAPRARRPLAPRLTDAKREAHAAFVATLGPNPIWNEYLGPADG